MNEPYLTPKQIAEQLQVTEKTVRTWIYDGRLRAVRAGRFWRIRESDLEAFLHEPTDERPADTPSKAAPPKGKRRQR
jgi:excisionase family DNA binding protein